MAKVVIDPISRIEGHLSVELEIDAGRVKSARTRGDMFRGFEQILLGRNPFDAVQIAQRICGVCPVSHGIESARCVENACGVTPNKNGRLLRNLALAGNYLQSHILHFYHLAALDFVDITAILKYSGSDGKLNYVKAWAQSELAEKKSGIDALTACSPFLPRYEGGLYIKDTDLNIAAIAHYVKAFDMRMKAHRLVAIFAGRIPHAIGLVPGGITKVPDKAALAEAGRILAEISDFVNNAYVPDVVAVARTFPQYCDAGRFGDFLAYGEFPDGNEIADLYFPRGIVSAGKKEAFDAAKITEQVLYSRYSSPSNLHPSQGQTVSQPEKTGAYTWLKAPRYLGRPMEVGPLARVMVAYLSGHADIKREVDGLASALGIGLPQLQSAIGRHAARAIEAKLLCKKIPGWIDQLDAGDKPRSECAIPESGEGAGLGEAARGALGHWISVKNGTIARYQCVVPTTWNASPRDDNGTPGPMEQALVGAPVLDDKNPIEPARIVRTFDPCLACAIHSVKAGKEIAGYRVC
ncbi:MAG TPA: nickel-dependent hydrogenase large subunit [Chitinivibrionales bacterium]|nr:nickel-dependent hydrogenase large subunit [Chitinivibrionales bacterium]